jgi:hypothetical protein
MKLGGLMVRFEMQLACCSESCANAMTYNVAVFFFKEIAGDFLKGKRSYPT